ncbi:MAG TPA: alpha-amylase family protein [Kineosporiaceae bacterium]
MTARREEAEARVNVGLEALVQHLAEATRDGRLGTADHAVLLRRLHRWGPDLLDGLQVYSGDPIRRSTLANRVLDLVITAHSGRRPALRELDERRTLRPDWFSGPDQVGYVCYPERFAGTLAGVVARIEYLRELGVTYLHLMPLLESRQGPDDGGYAVLDYRRVRPDLGTMDDLAALADALHDSGIALTLDLVLNHVAAEHAWARAAVGGDEHYAGYFLTYPDRTEPDRYEACLPEVFPDFAPGNFTWVPEFDGGRGRWVWTTFNAYQWDLDWANPDVFCELLDVILYLANVGVDSLRLDAIAFLWKRLGTSCQNQPEVHDIVAALRAAVRIAAPATLFKAEAIVSPEDLPAYLGTGRHAGRVADLAYHNSLMVQLWSTVASGDATLARHALALPPPKPVTTAWATYLRCHDDIGWAISDAVAAAAGLSGPGHREFLSRFYSGRFPGSFARGQIFQANPQTGDARISGTLASLAGLQAALEADDVVGVDLALGRIFLLHAVAFGYGGIPLIYMGDEVGLRNDDSYLADPHLAADNRWLHRPWMPWEDVERRHDPTSVEGRVFAGVRHLVTVRRSLPALHAAVESVPHDVSTPAVLTLLRRHPAGTLLQLYNVTSRWQPVAGEAVARHLGALAGHWWERLSAFAPRPDGDGQVWLPPYAAWWLTAG